MRLIDADALREDWTWREGQAYAMNDILRSIDDASTVEAYTAEEIAAAVEDRDAHCDTVECDYCNYRGLGCGIVTAKRIDGLVRTYRKRKEAGK